MSTTATSTAAPKFGRFFSEAASLVDRANVFLKQEGAAQGFADDDHLKVGEDFREGLLRTLASLLMSMAQSLAAGTKTLSVPAFEEALFNRAKTAPEMFREAWFAAEADAAASFAQKKDSKEGEENGEEEVEEDESDGEEKKNKTYKVVKFRTSLKRFVLKALEYVHREDPLYEGRLLVSEELIHRFSYAVDHFLLLMTRRMLTQMAYSNKYFKSGTIYKKSTFAILWTWIWAAFFQEDGKALIEADYSGIMDLLEAEVPEKKRTSPKKKADDAEGEAAPSKPKKGKKASAEVADADAAAADEEPAVADAAEGEAAPSKPKKKKDTAAAAEGEAAPSKPKKKKSAEDK